MNEGVLAAAIIQQAAMDWRWAINPTTPKKKDFVKTVCAKRARINEIRRFFRSGAADMYSGGQKDVIIKGLEEEYRRSKGRLQIEAYERGEIR